MVILRVFVLAALSLIFGCQQKPREEAVPSIQLEAVSVPPAAAPTQAPEVVSELTAEKQEVEVPAESSAPSAEQIQAALKNAGLYDGSIDGKIGPRTTKAIEAFQAQSNLKVDGKVGSQTWGKLKEYLNVAAPSSSEAIKN